MKKSQIGIEFLYFVVIAIILLLIYLGLSSNYLSLTSYRKDYLTAQNFLDKIRNEINLAGRVENGYIRIITFPSKINGKDYNIEVNGREVSIIFPFPNGPEYARILSTSVSSVNLNPGYSYRLKKEDDQVMITDLN